MASPGLSADVRRVLERELHNIGEPKVYDADDPPPVGSLHPGKRAPIQLDLDGATHESLAGVAHTSLYLYALQNDLDVVPGDTKAQVIKKILSHVKGEQS